MSDAGLQQDAGRQPGQLTPATTHSIALDAGERRVDHASTALRQAWIDPRGLTANGVLALQRVIGNAATSRLLRDAAHGPSHAVPQEETRGADAPGHAQPVVRVQRQDHANPASTPAVSALMTTAGITDFGPYIWDDSVPRFKVNTAFAGWTFADCIQGMVYQPELRAVTGEKGNKHGLMINRVKAARLAIFGVTQGVIDSIIASGGGAAPRVFTTAAAEDALNLGAHIVQRHVLGQGVMAGRREVALRAAFWRVNGVAMDLDPSGVSSVFAAATDANSSIGAAITGDFTTNWDANRRALAKGNDVKMTVPITGTAVAYRKHDAPYGDPYADAHFPKYIDPAKTGTRVLYAGDYTGAGLSADPNAPDLALDPLTDDVSATIATVYIIVKAEAAAPGGWYVHTAFPKA
ncbi:MAG TPA: hypothetical protein VN837_05895 [Chloroflexota bacterium]|nr:hypothetical protein [Chloroflexota bacterium]